MSSMRGCVECEGQFKGKRKQRPILITLITLLRGSWNLEEREGQTWELKEFTCFQTWNETVFQYQCWKDPFVFMCPEWGASLQSLERSILEMRWWSFMFVFAIGHFHGLTFPSPKAEMEKRTPAVLFWADIQPSCGLRGKIIVFLEHSVLAWGLRMINTNSWSEGKGTKSLLKSRQFFDQSKLLFSS